MTKKTDYLLSTLRGVLTLLFLATGTMKLVLPIAVLTQQSPLPGPFLRFIGACELLGSLGLILPGLLRIRQGLTLLAAGGLIVIMVGATVATLAVGGGAAALLPVVVGLLLIVVVKRFPATQPPSFRVERSITIQAAPDSIFPLIADFHRWSHWSPFENLDPAMKKTYTGAAHGLGAVYEWNGNRKAGAGRMEITDASPNSRLAIKLDFTRPFEGHNTAEFTLAPNGSSTTVTWAMSGPQTAMSLVMGVFCSMDAMLGKEFEKGLSNLKQVAENERCLEAV